MVVLTKGRIIAYGIIALNQKEGRRSLTFNEYEIFNKYLHNNLDFIQDWYHNDAKEELETYFDVIRVKDMYVYRLKPKYTIKELQLRFFTLWTELYEVISRKELTNSLNDLTYEDEQNIEEFKRVDENYQKEIIHNLSDYLKKRNELLKEFKKVRELSVSLIDIKGNLNYLMELIPDEEIKKLDSYSNSNLTR